MCIRVKYEIKGVYGTMGPCFYEKSTKCFKFKIKRIMGPWDPVFMRNVHSDSSMKYEYEKEIGPWDAMFVR